jgi:hypothetical protein
MIDRDIALTDIKLLLSQTHVVSLLRNLVVTRAINRLID